MLDGSLHGTGTEIGDAMTEHRMSAATVFLMIFGMVAAVDVLYLHLWKYRLYARTESRREHKLHTAQGALFVPAGACCAA